MRRGLSLLLAAVAIAGWSQAAASPRGRVLAVGGVYFKSANPRAQHDWYVEHLSIGSVEASGGWYAVFAGELAGKPPSKLGTTWTVLPPSAANFNGPWMIDYLVDHLDALMQRLKAEGVRIEPKIVTDSRGKFGWAYDGEGNKLELWEPAEVPQATSFDLTFGIGGVYFKARNQAAQYAWYAKHLGIVAKPNKGVRFPWQLSYLKLSTT
jgi:predicted enzyme related to lactoylglutathione lyase